MYETFGGNLELQSELSFDLAAEAGAANYESRQLGNRFRIEIVDLRPPGAGPHFKLRVKVEPIAEFDLGSPAPAITESDWLRVSGKGSGEEKLQITGVITEQRY